MTRCQVAKGGDDLLVWRETVNMLNEQSQTAVTSWSSGQLSDWAWGITEFNRF